MASVNFAVSLIEVTLVSSKVLFVSLSITTTSLPVAAIAKSVFHHEKCVTDACVHNPVGEAQFTTVPLTSFFHSPVLLSMLHTGTLSPGIKTTPVIGSRTEYSGIVIVTGVPASSTTISPSASLNVKSTIPLLTITPGEPPLSISGEPGNALGEEIGLSGVISTLRGAVTGLPSALVKRAPVISTEAPLPPGSVAVLPVKLTPALPTANI